MEGRTLVAAALAAGMCLVAGAFTASAIADPPPGAHVATPQLQPPLTAATTPAQEVVYEVTTIDDVVVVTTVATETARPIHPAAAEIEPPAQLIGGAP